MPTPRYQWGKVYQGYAGSVARWGYSLSLETRLLLAAISRANNTGHAIFKENELREILAKEQPDGTRKPASRSTIYNITRKLKEAGLALSGGGEICIWLPREFWARNVKKGFMCPVHRTYEPGYAGEDEEPEAA